MSVCLVSRAGAASEEPAPARAGLALRLSRPYVSYHITGHLLSKPQMRFRRSFRFRFWTWAADSSTRSAIHLRKEYIHNAGNSTEKRWLYDAHELIFDIRSCRSSSFGAC
jgi:hypothetical protein